MAASQNFYFSVASATPGRYGFKVTGSPTIGFWTTSSRASSFLIIFQYWTKKEKMVFKRSNKFITFYKNYLTTSEVNPIEYCILSWPLNFNYFLGLCSELLSAARPVPRRMQFVWLAFLLAKTAVAAGDWIVCTAPGSNFLFLPLNPISSNIKVSTI